MGLSLLVVLIHLVLSDVRRVLSRLVGLPVLALSPGVVVDFSPTQKPASLVLPARPAEPNFLRAVWV